MLHDMTALDFFNSLHDPTPDSPVDADNDDTGDQLLVNAASSKQHISPADIRKVLSSVKGKATSSPLASDMTINGATYSKDKYCPYL